MRLRKPRAILRNWAVRVMADAYTAPECITTFLAGEVYGHPDFKDGHRIYTSHVEHRGKFEDGDTVETQNTRYILDGICPHYKKWNDLKPCHKST